MLQYKMTIGLFENNLGVSFHKSDPNKFFKVKSWCYWAKMGKVGDFTCWNSSLFHLSVVPHTDAVASNKTAWEDKVNHNQKMKSYVVWWIF